MKAKFFRSDVSLGLGLQLEPETTDEQLLLEEFMREAHASDYRLQFNGFEHNMPGRPLSNGLTAVRGSIVKASPRSGRSSDVDANRLLTTSSLARLSVDCPTCGAPAGVSCVKGAKEDWMLCDARVTP